MSDSTIVQTTFYLAFVIDLFLIIYTIRLVLRLGGSSNIAKTAFKSMIVCLSFGFHHIIEVFFGEYEKVITLSEAIEAGAVILFGYAAFQIYQITIIASEFEANETEKVRNIYNDALEQNEDQGNEVRKHDQVSLEDDKDYMSEVYDKALDILSPVVGEFIAKAQIRAACLRIGKNREYLFKPDIPIFVGYLELICTRILGDKIAEEVKIELISEFNDEK